MELLQAYLMTSEDPRGLYVNPKLGINFLHRFEIESDLSNIVYL